MGPLHLEYVSGHPGPAGLPKDGLSEICLAGRSNVGKSSVINRLSPGNPAKISSTPGCTRLLNVYREESGFYVVDLPGYGYAKVPGTERMRWASWIDAYLSGREQLAGVVLVVDARHPGLENDVAMAEWLAHLGRRFIVAVNKSDKLGRAGVAASERAFEALGPSLAISCRTGIGFPALRGWIRSTAQAAGRTP
jgi:GTP-binding protein